MLGWFRASSKNHFRASTIPDKEKLLDEELQRQHRRAIYDAVFPKHTGRSSFWKKSSSAQRKTPKDLASLPLFHQHAYYVDYSEDIPHQERPSYFTVMRNPVERYLSQYYYWRTLGGKFGDQVRGVRGKSLEECAGSSLSEEIFSCPLPNYITAYLCGSDPVCTSPPSHESFLLAKANLRDMAVTGIIENLTLTTTAISHFYPAFRHLKPLAQNTVQNRNFKRKSQEKTVDRQTRRMIEKLNKYDMELYDLARLRLHRFEEHCLR
eukprot:CAMPEP_0119132780 /NCGR_PEP_ID=MMETSP1310-20130426/12293_1 /TAXON_ID=464262 /ORGANISM="Genus nov. species nov., Strain RCC2339" /LENGTH=264 /DNA_ID=CAMNT_0007123433 /DNA_START=143 /DNA_END=937 /DNA_ORIENTATION=-